MTLTVNLNGFQITIKTMLNANKQKGNNEKKKP